ncbi:MAG: GDYXXLXY domain-containing protein [Campylobacterales bacterium]|nr:GDYXXLXY domain-containing protein [Campylobacterales bacterium]MBN2832622.1 GDYXXLXY domain-containing protein [Campylobacterales bacterium]
MKWIKQLSWILFGILCLSQVSIIGLQIMKYERILTKGEVFYFDVLPLDPYDPLRGRYVTLRFKGANQAPLAQGEEPMEELRGYALLEQHKNITVIKEVTFNKPKGGNFLEVNVYSTDALYRDTHTTQGIMVHFSLPFDRFYMREDLAPKAEMLLRARSGVAIKAKLRVLEGKGIIEDLMVGDVSLSQFILTQ